MLTNIEKTWLSLSTSFISVFVSLNSESMVKYSKNTVGDVRSVVKYIYFYTFLTFEMISLHFSIYIYLKNVFSPNAIRATALNNLGILEVHVHMCSGTFSTVRSESHIGTTERAFDGRPFAIKREQRVYL